MSLGIVAEHLINMISRQVDDNGIVVWYDPADREMKLAYFPKITYFLV